MDILMVCHYGLYQDRSFSFVHGQAKAYAALGHRVRVVIPVALGKSGPTESRFLPLFATDAWDGVELFYLRYFSLSRYGEGGFNAKCAAKAVRRYRKVICNDFNPAFIHAHTLGFDSDVGAALKGWLGCPLVVTTHGSDTTLPHKAGRLTDLARRCDSADLVVAVSSVLKAKLEQSGTLTPIEVILNGFRLQSVPEEIEKTPDSWIQVGHLVDQKRVDVTIRAFGTFYQNHPNATLTVVGQGPKRQALESLCDQLGIAHAVRFLGQIDNQKVLAEMSRHQYFVMPSVGEGFGIVYLEAMACGCITVGTRGEGIADLIQNRRNGFLVPPESPDAIVETVESCLQDANLAQTVAAAGRQDAMKLTWETNAKRYISLIEETIL